MKIYEFNAKLRSIIFPLIEDVEINLRCKLANHLSCKYGNLGFEDENYFVSKANHSLMINDFNEQKQRGKNPFIKNFEENYTNGKIPFYAAIELFTFGMLSKCFSNLKNEDKKEIATGFDVGYTYLESWLKSLTNIRNICAHYGRIYNLKLSIKPKLYKEYPNDYNYRIYGILLTLKHMVSNRSLWSSFINDLKAIIDIYREYIKLDNIGFPNDWEELLDKNAVKVTVPCVPHSPNN